MYTYGFNGGYDDLLDKFTIVNDFILGDYQGDYIYHLSDGARQGYLVVGYGSCEGCDDLQSCETLAEVKALQESIINGIRWFNSTDELGAWARAYDFEGQWYWHDPDFETTVKYFRNL